MRKILFFALFAVILSVHAYGISTDGLEEAVPGSAREIMGELSVEDVLEGGSVLANITDWAKEQVLARVGQAAGSAGTVLAVTLLCSVAAAAEPGGKTPSYVLLGGALAITGVCAGSIKSYLGQVSAAMEDMSEFSRALLPCIAAANTAVGRGASGAARYAISALFMDVLMTLGSRMVLPMLYGYCAVCTANAALPQGAMGGPVKLMSWFCGTMLKLLTGAFTLCLSLSGLVAGNTDKLAVSAVKTAVTAALPVVGKIIADAADTYLAGAKLLRGAVGGFGSAAVICVCLGPFIGVGLHYLMFKAAAMLAEPFSDSRLSGLVSNIAACYGMALGLLGSASAMLFVSVVFGTEALTG